MDYSGPPCVNTKQMSATESHVMQFPVYGFTASYVRRVLSAAVGSTESA
jgi:hypothetical protein